MTSAGSESTWNETPGETHAAAVAVVVVLLIGGTMTELREGVAIHL